MSVAKPPSTETVSFAVTAARYALDAETQIQHLKVENERLRSTLILVLEEMCRGDWAKLEAAITEALNK